MRYNNISPYGGKFWFCPFVADVVGADDFGAGAPRVWLEGLLYNTVAGVGLFSVWFCLYFICLIVVSRCFVGAGSKRLCPLARTGVCGLESG